MIKRNVHESEFKFVVNELINQRVLDKKYRDYALEGQYRGFREFHINPDWFLIYRVEMMNLS